MDARFACFIGWSNTGKTGFVEACASALSARGVKVGAIKRVHHGAAFNVPGKDSSRFFQAGADAAIVSDDEALKISRVPPSWDASFALSLFPEADVILIEGRLVSGAVRVIVGGSATDESALKRPLSGFDAIVTGDPVLSERAKGYGLSVFSPDDSEAFIDSYFTGGAMEERTVTVTTGGVELPLNPFVKETIENVVLGLLKPLKKTNLEGEIVIRIGAAKG